MLRRAFTLIELLVVIAIIALLVGILLPALGKARTSARSLQSAANLTSMGKVQYAYATDYQDSFVNPFTNDPSKFVTTTGGTVYLWQGYVDPMTSQSNQSVITPMGQSSANRVPEAYAFIWASPVMAYLQERNEAGTSYISPVLRDPRDQKINERHAALLAASRRQGGTQNDRLDWAWIDTSYYASPTLWRSHRKYASDAAYAIGTSARDIARNRFSDVSYSSEKVMIFERIDFSKDRRTAAAGGGGQNGAPQWNNPSGTPNVCFVDGSVSKAPTSRLVTLTTDPDVTVRNAFTPRGLWNTAGIGLAITTFGLTNDGLELNPGWQQFYWATADGVRGRDFSRGQ